MCARIVVAVLLSLVLVACGDNAPLPTATIGPTPIAPGNPPQPIVPTATTPPSPTVAGIGVPRASFAPTADARRAVLLADLDALDQDRTLIGCLTLLRPTPAPVSNTGNPGLDRLAQLNAQAAERRFDETQTFLRQHPALDRYVAWMRTAYNTFVWNACSLGMRNPTYMDEYLAYR